MSMSLRSISLSPVELPVSVSSRLPPPLKATGTVLFKMSAALFAVPATITLFPNCPDESIVPLPARVKRRSIEIEGVCVVW